MNTTVLIFISFVPLLYAADFAKNKVQFFNLSFLATLIWNVGATWWVFNSTEFAVIAFLLNAFLMSLPLLGYYIFKKKYGIVTGSFALIVFWMCFEYLHLSWQLSWPWLTLGNVFASHPDYVMWYRYTGVGGGTLWILLANLLIKYLFTECVEGGKENKVFSKILIISIVVIALPVCLSYMISKKKEPTAVITKQVVIVQPDIDPYQKFDPNSFNLDMDKLITLSESKIDTNTVMLLWPETALSQPVEQSELLSSGYYNKVIQFLNKHPKITLQSGVDCYVIYNHINATVTAKHFPSGQYFDAFNSAVTIQSGHKMTFYNKSKLVPGVETLPTYFKFLAPMLEKFGGSTGGYGRDSTSKVFDIDSTGLKTAPIICYESIYGGYVATYAAKGANLLTIMTNDGWWGNTPGYKQHQEYARLRAIENNCYVIRSANTGISSVIDNMGNVLQTRSWDVASVIKADIPIRNPERTFYSLHGDYLYYFACIITCFLLVFHLVTFFRRKNN